MDWNLDADSARQPEDRTASRSKILAAGALYHAYCIGEVLGVFELAETAVRRWQAGVTRTDAGDASARLLRYWQRRDEFPSSDERRVLYARVLNLGGSTLVRDENANGAFLDLWSEFLRAVAAFIERAEEQGLSPGSKEPIYAATEALQANLSGVTGLLLWQAPKIHEQLREALAIVADLRLDEGKTHRGRSTLLKNIQFAANRRLGTSPKVHAMWSSAVEAHRIFAWIADFDRTTITDDRFSTVLSAVDAFVTAQASLER